MAEKVEIDLGTLIKLGSIAVHADEMLSADGREVDKQTVKNLLADPDVVKWIKDNVVYLPRKRVGADYDDRGPLGLLSGTAPKVETGFVKGKGYVSNCPKAREEKRDKSWYDEEARRMEHEEKARIESLPKKPKRLQK